MEDSDDEEDEDEEDDEDDEVRASVRTGCSALLLLLLNTSPVLQQSQTLLLMIHTVGARPGTFMTGPSGISLCMIEWWAH